MTPQRPTPANALAVHFDPEPFQSVAQAQLMACPLVPPGICLNPACSRPFAPTRDWQRYCGADCRRMDETEMRRVGHKVAPALLAWRMGKYERHDPDLRALARIGRTYVSRIQSDWYVHRLARAAERGR